MWNADYVLAAINEEIVITWVGKGTRVNKNKYKTTY